MTCARTVSGVGAAAQTAESIALSSQVGSASWVTTAEMGAIEAKVFLFAAFAPHPLHTCKGSVRFGGGAGGRDRRRGTCSSPKRQQDTCGRPRVGGGARAQVAQRLEQPSGLFHQASHCLSTGRPASFAAPPVMRVRLWNMTDCHQGVTATECSLRYTLLDYVCKAQRKGFVP